MRQTTLLLLAAVVAGASAQSTGDYKTFRKAAVGDVETYTTPVNSSLWAINGSGAFTLLAQSNFANASHSHAFSDLTGKPTTIGGYGITDFNSLGDARWSLLGHTHAASDITSGVLNHARLGTGGGGSTKFLREDGTWQTVATGGGTWGSITGTLSDQTDLASALAAKASQLSLETFTNQNDLDHNAINLELEEHETRIEAIEDSYVPDTRTVNGHALSADVTVTKSDVGLGSVENTALSTWTGSANITTLGTIGTGVWAGDRIGPTRGGTGLNSYALGDLLYSDATDNLAKLAGNTTTTRTFLSQTGNGSVSAAPAWRQVVVADVSGLGTLATQSGTFSGTHSGTSSGTNTGDQTSIVGITGTTAQFNTALSDGDFATGGGTATGTNTGDQTITLTGDVTGSGTGSFAATIATGVIVNADINASAAIALSKLATDPLARANHTGTQAVSTISDATTVGQNLVKLTNPSAITYPRMNADNTVTARTMAQSRTDLALHPVTITAITGGSQATTSTSLADVTGSTITFPDTGWYEWEYFIIHSSGATSTGAFFAVNTGGTMVNNYITYCISYDVLSTDKDTYCVDGYNSVIASTSSRATANNRCRMQGTIHVTTAGGMVLRFATEVNASAITITELSGWYRNL